MNDKSDGKTGDPLAGTAFEGLPDVFAMRDDGNGIIQEREPCYNILAECFLGSGTSGTRYDEGSIVVTRVVPNVQMQPLNRAAAINYVKWISRLPEHRAAIDAGDMAEAAQMLAADAAKMNKVEWQKAVTTLAVEIKLRREGKDARDLPAIGHNFVEQRGKSTAPPILGAKMSDMAQRSPGETRLAVSMPANAPPPNVRRGTAAPLGTPPPR